MSPQFGATMRDKGRVYEWVSPGWWQPILTDKEREIMASCNIPPEWEPTQEEIERAQRYAEKLLGTNPRADRRQQPLSKSDGARPRVSSRN